MYNHSAQGNDTDHIANPLGIAVPQLQRPLPSPQLGPAAGSNDLLSAGERNDNENVFATLHNSAIGVIHLRKPSDVGLHVQTNISTFPKSSLSYAGSVTSNRPSLDDDSRPSTLHPAVASRRSFDTATNASVSPTSSVASSPKLISLNDVTPLPSPLVPSLSSELWKLAAGRPKSNSQTSMGSIEAGGLLPPAIPISPPLRKKKLYNFTALNNPTTTGSVESHARNRSISETMPDALQNVRPRHVTTPGSVANAKKEHNENTRPTEVSMHREDHISAQRGILKAELRDPVSTLPSPPPSNRSTVSDEGDDASQTDKVERISIKNHLDGQTTDWRVVRSLGQGSFSQVVLARRSSSVESSSNEESRDLVAIKIMAHAPVGATDEERLDTSIKREIEVLRSISHPCLPHMRGYEDTPARALLVLDYCPGGDMFDFATRNRSSLTPALIQRIFAELVNVVSHLHGQYIVHRDIKLENVLFNVPSNQLPMDPTTYTHPLVTLTDLGLSKRIPQPPASPLLNHPCGSEDYIAPEILLGQPYDGRATDAWALGVLLYALMESRLPFDLIPDPRKPHKKYKSEFELQRAKKHRIARSEWIWCEFGDEWGEWVDEKCPSGLKGARECVEGLLKKVSRGRLSLEQLAEKAWVKSGICIEGGLSAAKRIT